MTKPLHTAAPWGVDHFNEHCAFYSPTVEGDYFMRVEFSDDMPESEIAPNISLIGAAPEMLEAAELASKLCTLITQWADADREDASVIMDEIVELAQDNEQPAKATAKAKAIS